MERTEVTSSHIPEARPGTGAGSSTCRSNGTRAGDVTWRNIPQRPGTRSPIPLFEGDAATVRQTNQDLLAGCDAVILFYGAGDEGWKRSIDQRAEEGHRIPGRAAVIRRLRLPAGPTTESKKELIELEEPNLINGLQGFSDAGDAQVLFAVERKGATA